MMTIYEATKNSDRLEGRGHTIRIAAFTKREDAEQAAKGHGVMGMGNGDVDPITVYENFVEYLSKSKADLRKKALAKLTPEEKAALGIVLSPMEFL
jgi:hypothetical protein